MSRIWVGWLALAAVGAGCGSSGGPLFGGFVPSGGSAVIFDPAVCDISFVGSTAVAGVMIDFADFADSCGVINSTQLCGTKANSTRVLAMVMSGEVGAASIGPLQAGTFRYLAEPPTGKFNAAAGTAARVDGTCQPQPGTKVVSMSGGSVTITSIGASRVVGKTSMKFNNGEEFEHEFDVPVCPAALDFCQRFEYCGSHACVQ